MAETLTFDVKGFRELFARLDKAPSTLVQEVQRELKDGADRIAGRALRKVPKGEGGIARSISVQEISKTQYDVVSAAFYSAFVEWGTKSKAQIPPELAAYAAQFKGYKGGTLADFLKAITGWVRRNTIKFSGAGRNLTLDETARIIMIHILKYGVKPQPFFFDGLKQEEPIILKHIEAVINDI